MGLRRLTPVESEGELHICEPWEHPEFGEWKFNIQNTEPEDAALIKELPWEETHRQWDDDYDCWTADLDSLFQVVAHLENSGYEVTMTDEVLRSYGENSVNQ